MANEALYSVKVTTESSALDKLGKDVDALKNTPAIPLKADATGASQSLEELKKQTGALAKDAVIRINADSTQAMQAVGAVRDELGRFVRQSGAIAITADTASANAAIEGVGEKAKSIGHEKIKIDADTKEAEGKFDSLKEKAKGALSGIGAGFLAGGAAVGVDKSLEAAKADLESQENLKIALRNTGVEGDALNAKFKQTEQTVASMSDQFAKPKEEIRAIQTEIAGLGGASGQSAQKMTEIGLALEQAGIPAKALKALIVGAADPESAAQIDQLGTKFGGLKSALANATTPAEKMDAVFKAVGPTLAGMKDAADGPLGSMAKMEETGKNLEISFGSLIFGVLTPFIPVVSGIGTVINSAVIPAITAVTGFISDNKVAVGVLAIGVGVLAIAMNAAAIGTTSLGIAQKAQAIATGVVTGAQTLLNAVMAVNPIVLVVAGIAALAAGAIYLYNNVKPVHDAFDAVWTVIKGLGAFIGTFVSNEVASLVKGFEGVGSVIHGIVTMNFDEVKKGVGQVGDAVVGSQSAGTAAVGAFKKSIDDSSKSLVENKGKAKDAGDASVKAATDAAAAQKNFNDEIGKTSSAYNQQIDDAKKVGQNIATEYSLWLQQLAKDQADHNTAAVAFDRDQLAQWKGQFEEKKKVVDQFNKFAKATENAGLTFNAPAAAKAKTEGPDPLVAAKEAAQAASLELDFKQKLSNAEHGTKETAEQKLGVENEYLHVLLQQVGALDLKTQKEKEAAAKAVSEAEGKVTLANDNLTIDAAGRDLDAAKALAAHKLEVAKELEDARLATISDGSAREIAIRQLAFDRENAITQEALQSGKAVADDEAKLYYDRQVKLQQDILAIKAKYGKEGVEQDKTIQKAAAGALETIWGDFFHATQRMSQLDLSQKRFDFEKQDQQLTSQLKRGEISQQEYNLKIQKLNQDRNSLETSQDKNKWKLIEGQAQSAFGGLVQQGEKWLEQRVIQMITEGTTFQLTEDLKTAAATAGSVVRIAASVGEGIASVATAGANMVAAVATEIWEAISSLGPIAGPIVGIAAAGAIYEGYRGLKSTLGFATGGIGMIGENGPEVISPVKDFSNFATSLTTNVAKEVRKSLANPNGGHQVGRSRRNNISVTGNLKTRGRDLNYSLTTNAINKRTEQLIPTS